MSLLGPVSVTRDGTRRPVAGTKLQSLLALLALAVPHTVSDDRLLEELWGDEQPAKPANALQALVSTLRRLLGRDAVARQGSGYALQLEPDDVDTIRFEHLVATARDESARSDHAAAAERYRAALALVRGEPLADLVDHWFALDASSRLGELIVTAEEESIDAQLAVGHHAEILPHVLELISRHPLRERLRGQLILALYRTGRQAEALRAYHEARARLRDELGLDPGPELQALERSVLAQDPSLAAPIAVASPVAARAALPMPLTSFLGRQAELAGVRAALASARLVTLVGPGGVGKSRLAVEIARQLSTEREVWMVELAPIVDALAVAEAVASGLGAPEHSAPDGAVAPSPGERAVGRLGERAAVVVLDNCEHVAEAAAQIVLELLRGCTNLRILTTSREPLHIDGEHEIAVAPLDDAVAADLFVERARAVQPMIGTGTDDEAISSLVRHLDGLPLAIELAAARTKTFPVGEIIEPTRRSVRPPARRPSWRPPLATMASRRRSGGATTSSSRTSSGRSGGSPCATAGRRAMPSSGCVATVPSSWRRASSTVRCSPWTPRAPWRRFGMLESLRAYGLARLREEGELDEARADHLAWCIDLATEAAAHVRSAGQLPWLDRLDDEHDNLRAALGFAVASDPEGALRLLGPLITPWWYRGRRLEVVDWADAALAASTHLATPAKAVVLSRCGLVSEPGLRRGPDGTSLRAQLELAETRQREALAIDEANGDELAAAYDRLMLLNTLARQASIGELVGTGRAGRADGPRDGHVRPRRRDVRVVRGPLHRRHAGDRAGRPRARRRPYPRGDPDRRRLR